MQPGLKCWNCFFFNIATCTNLNYRRDEELSGGTEQPDVKSVLRCTDSYNTI